MTDEFTLEELENMSGLSIRTLRFYIQEGLLPGPDTRGKFARYSQKHLDTIHFIHRLKDLHIPLLQIRHLLDTLSSEDIERIIQSRTENNFNLSSPQFFIKSDELEESSEHQQKSSALDYIRSLENLQGSLKINESINRYKPPSAPIRAPAPLKDANMNKPMRTGETWQRIHLAEGVELQVRQPMGMEKEQMVEELIDNARQLFRKTNKKGENKNESKQES